LPFNGLVRQKPSCHPGIQLALSFSRLRFSHSRVLGLVVAFMSTKVWFPSFLFSIHSK